MTRSYLLLLPLALAACDTPQAVRQLSIATADGIVTLDRQIERSVAQLNQLNGERNALQVESARLLNDEEIQDFDRVRRLGKGKDTFDEVLELAGKYIAAEQKPIRQRLEVKSLAKPVGLPEAASRLDQLGQPANPLDRAKFLAKYGQATQKEFEQLEAAEKAKKEKDQQAAASAGKKEAK